MPWTPPKHRLTEKGFRKFIKTRTWTYAKKMPQWPHQWTRRRFDDSVEDQELFEAAVIFIREHGTRRKFEDDGWFVYYDCDGRQYWTMGAELGATIIINRAWLNWKERVAAGEDPESVATNDPPDGVIPVRPPESDPDTKVKSMKSTRALRAQARAYGRHYYRGGLEVLTPLAILELKKSDLPTLYPAQRSYLRRLANGKAVIPGGFEKLFEAVIDHAKRLLL